MPYFVISVTPDLATVREYADKPALEEDLNEAPGDSYTAMPCHPDIPHDYLEMWPKGSIVIKGELIVPEAEETVTRWAVQ